MKTYKTTINLEVEAENEEEAIRKMYDLITSGEVQITETEEVSKEDETKRM